MSSERIRARLRRLLWRRPNPPTGSVSGVVPEPEVEATRPCPHCQRSISRGATVCIHCEREIVPLMSYGEFARRFGSPHAGGPPHERPEE